MAEIPIDISDFYGGAPPLPPPSDTIAVPTNLLEAIQQRLAQLEADNIKLKDEVSAQSYASGVPEEMKRRDPLVDGRRMSAARSVTIMTRPVAENPELYKNVVEAGSIFVPDKKSGEENA